MWYLIWMAVCVVCLFTSEFYTRTGATLTFIPPHWGIIVIKYYQVTTCRRVNYFWNKLHFSFPLTLTDWLLYNVERGLKKQCKFQSKDEQINNCWFTSNNVIANRSYWYTFFTSSILHQKIYYHIKKAGHENYGRTDCTDGRVIDNSHMIKYCNIKGYE